MFGESEPSFSHSVAFWRMSVGRGRASYDGVTWTFLRRPFDDATFGGVFGGVCI